MLLPAAFLIILGSTFAWAGSLDSTHTSNHPLDTLWSDVKATFTDAGLLYTRPLRFDTRDWILTGGMFGGTALLMSADESLREAVLKTRGTDGDRVMSAGRELGERLPGVILAGSLYTTGLVFDLRHVRLMGRHVLQSLTYSALIGTLLKYGFGRHRPFLNEGRLTFEGPGYHEDHYLSLPSGHATVAFAVASSLAADIENPWATAGLYTLATVTAVSRMYHDRHWGSDVFFAAALASAIGYGTANLHEPKSLDETSFFVTPSANGIAIGWTW